MQQISILVPCKFSSDYHEQVEVPFHIFQTEHFPVVKFALGSDKNMSFL